MKKWMFFLLLLAGFVGSDRVVGNRIVKITQSIRRGMAMITKKVMVTSTKRVMVTNINMQRHCENQYPGFLFQRICSKLHTAISFYWWPTTLLIL